jgi:hypothetical protein
VDVISRRVIKVEIISIKKIKVKMVFEKNIKRIQNRKLKQVIM